MNARTAVILAIALAAAPIHAQSPDPTLAAAARWIGRSLILRGFYAPNELHYDPAGKAEGTPKSTDWTLAGVDLEAIKRIDPATLELDGVRVAIRFNPDNQLFERHPQKDQHLKILVAIPGTGSPSNQLLGTEPIEETLARIFSIGIDPALQRSMPDFWRHYFDPHIAWDGEPVYPAPATVTAPPTLAHRTDVPETPEAEHDKVRGSLLMRLTVDEHGAVKFVSVLKPLGYGLDARAIEQVRRWTFTPAQASGAPAPMKLDIAETFAPRPPLR
ncbi:TonB family C-terminal domain-containing protein [Granulicella pectinivorans]|uniref:TonB family C-terminal domain-containing protein n=1 Tax=Granulicella pectinivorans TaxID=474950 RepID=A0A1I6L5Z8_9BACT|nr:energy transducer TonB [Granulicella pectinivorans]SFR98852.1 TonB family C-terminal domain-containing protein [Granulicella pectinivorans]